MGTPAGVGALQAGDACVPRRDALLERHCPGDASGAWSARPRRARVPHAQQETPMGMINEFREFAMRGDVVDLAVGVVIGAAFGKIVTSLVDNVIMPPIGYLLGGVDFS